MSGVLVVALRSYDEPGSSTEHSQEETMTNLVRQQSSEGVNPHSCEIRRKPVSGLLCDDDIGSAV